MLRCDEGAAHRQRFFAGCAEVSSSESDGAVCNAAVVGCQDQCVVAVGCIACVKNAQLIAVVSSDGAKLNDKAVASEIVELFPSRFVDDDIDISEPFVGGVSLPLTDNLSRYSSRFVSPSDLIANPSEAGPA